MCWFGVTGPKIKLFFWLWCSRCSLTSGEISKSFGTLLYTFQDTCTCISSCQPRTKYDGRWCLYLGMSVCPEGSGGYPHPVLTRGWGVTPSSPIGGGGSPIQAQSRYPYPVLMGVSWGIPLARYGGTLLSEGRMGYPLPSGECQKGVPPPPLPTLLSVWDCMALGQVMLRSVRLLRFPAGGLSRNYTNITIWVGAALKLRVWSYAQSKTRVKLCSILKLARAFLSL